MEIQSYNNYSKNELEEIKNNFVKIKSLISHKRKPEENIQNILEKIEDSNINKSSNDNIEMNNKNKEEKNKLIINESRSNKKIKKFIIKDSNIYSQKGGIIKNDNKNIDFYFDKKKNIEKGIDNNNIINKKFKVTHYKNNNSIKEHEKDFISKINEEINKSKNFSIINTNKIKYNNSFLNTIRNFIL